MVDFPSQFNSIVVLCMYISKNKLRAHKVIPEFILCLHHLFFADNMLIVLVSWMSMFLFGVGGLFSFAVGLYYLAELVEEYTVLTERIIRYTILTELALHVLMLFFENVPWSMIIVGFVAHVYYSSLLKTYPAFQFTSASFLGSLVFIFILHVMAFRYFGEVWYPFSEVLGYFTIFIWLVPFMFLLSLSANEMILPQTMGQPANEEIVFSSNNDFVSSYMKAKRRGLFFFLSSVKEGLLPTRTKKVF